MTTYTDRDRIIKYIAGRISNGQYYVTDDCGYEYRITCVTYSMYNDKVLMELDPHHIRERDWPNFHDTYRFSIKPTKIIFSGPATIVFWDDGTKTVVKCTDRDEFDFEKGIALCYMKRLLGNDNSFHHIFKKFVHD